MRKKKVLGLMPYVLVAVLILAVGVWAITQEASEEDFELNEMLPEDIVFDFDDLDNIEEEWEPGWIPPGPPRWFRSNAGGMMLQETPSRLAALRNQYALVVDYIPPHELDPRLTSFYREDYIIEVRVLYEEGTESRKQWLFRDRQGATRLNAVFLSEYVNPGSNFSAETGETGEPEEQAPAASGERLGFIELYDERSLITKDFWLYDDGGETFVEYFYRNGILIKTETRQRSTGYRATYTLVYTDNFRYNRSFSLRNVERMYHDAAAAEPVRLLFPSRVLDAASDVNFISDKLFVGSEFLGNVFIGEAGSRIIFDTDSRGRILTQTMIDDEDEVVWVISNVWADDRIISIVRTENENIKRIEYEYDGDGNRIVQRDIHNGVLERIVHIEGKKETEELMFNGVVVLRAYWENGRKIHEERVRQ
ncbi:MAG: hypothetical protein FWD36_09545 [Treponema sp.]|nr:hypothetical protein [Treponema sp.]